MKMDIANYNINTVKPLLIQQAVEYEKAKFTEYLKENQGQSSDSCFQML